MTVAKGVVGKINSRVFNGKTAWSFVLKNESTWYSAGWTAPQFKEGDSIQFEISARGSYLDAKNIVPWDGSGAQNAPSVAQVAARAPTARRPFTAGKSQEEKAYWAKKDASQEETQRRIEIQAARNTAVETVKILFANGLIAVPEKIKKSGGKEYLDALINEYVDQYLENTSVRLAGATASVAEIAQDIPTGVDPNTDEVKWDE